MTARKMHAGELDIDESFGLFSGESREVFRAILQVGDATWALIFIPCYLDTNPVGVGDDRRSLIKLQSWSKTCKICGS